ncbi:MAG TPA: hypothetical protein VIM11_12550 [Tepidisphaeraceae bacterium]|jgi:hypothetical protein
MTFSVMLVKDDQPRVVGTLWTTDEADAVTLAPIMCGCPEGQKIHVRRTDDREIPLRVATPGAIHFS